ncbi:MAG: AbrB/MazE/SpoVT family DNA-binding domain-containing protein [Anaerolineaceae bacterium]|jgi:AbrB family looped-hinge helix DNA binding protein|nr:AbrB/MazE/SpoVT family DNA-binding domain-containing protein [Anaerolineaceae bacterium]PKO03154.1 MAG: AbrB family transcriptional regulator [Chloroflexi bacterium HGW-Chloroflexi-5]
MNAKLSQKGWIVIPSALREKYGLKPGVDVHIIDYGGVLSMVPISKNPISEGRGFLKGTNSLTQALLNEHKLEQERDKR